MGEIQGQYIADSLDLKNQAGPFTLEIFSGSQDDTNSISFYNGAMMGISADWQQTVKGLVILAAVAFDLIPKRKKK